MKKIINYLLLILLLLGLNLICFSYVFLFYEIDTTLDTLLSYSTIIFFVISCVILAIFIRNKSLSPLISAFIIYTVIFVIRFVEVAVIKCQTGFTWCSICPLSVILDAIFKQGDDYIYWWTVIIFPLLQPLGTYLCYKITVRRKKS